MFEGLQDQIQRTSDHSGSFMYWSIPCYWLRERRLSKRSVQWVSQQGIVESSHRTKGRYQETIRAELRYSYSFEGENYTGHVIRDCCFAPSSANNLVDENAPGQKIEILVNPENPLNPITRLGSVGLSRSLPSFYPRERLCC